MQRLLLQEDAVLSISTAPPTVRHITGSGNGTFEVHILYAHIAMQISIAIKQREQQKATALLRK